MSDEGQEPDQELDGCFQSTQQLCTRRGVAVTRLHDGPGKRLNLRLAGAQHEWTLEVDCSWPRTTKLPDVVLRQPRELLAHVGWSGLVCVTDSQGLSLDRDRQADIVAQTVLEAFGVLERSAVDALGDRTAFYDELEGYWSGFPNLTLGRSAVEVDDVDRLIMLHFDERLSQGAMLYFTEVGVSAPSEFRVAGKPWHRAMYVALDAPLAPPKPGIGLTSREVDAVLALMSPQQQVLWKKCVAGSEKRERPAALLVSVPRPAGGRSVFGFAFTVEKGKVCDRFVFPITVLRHTLEYMRERGGTSRNVWTKHVAILGCGSVGSEVADALASSGVGRLTLVDPDTMSEDNVFRHALGRDKIGVPKVLALRDDLTRKYPGLDVQVAVLDAQEWLAKADRAAGDGFVVAVGIPTLERSLAGQLRGIGKAVPLVVTWLEPLDLGGHSLRLSTAGEGCLDCIYRDEEGLDALIPQTAFLMPGQVVTRNLTGCSSIFVPYGALQSRRTALLAAEHMLRAFDAAAAPAYSFWVGEGTEAARQGLRTTAWWERAVTMHHVNATRQLFGHPCRRCRSAQ